MSRVIREIDDGHARLGSFIVTRTEAAFRPRLVDGGFGGDGAEPAFDEEPISIEAAAYARGLEEGRRTVEMEYAAERDALARLAESLEVLQPQPANALALLLAETVDRLVREVVGAVDIDPITLLARAKAAAELVAANAAPTKLRAHPSDLACLAEAELDLVLEADPSLARGAIVLETGDGWIEDGPEIRLARLRTELDKMVAVQ